MPIYDTKCVACGNLEINVFAHFEDVIKCSKCGERCERLPRVFNPQIFPSDGIFLQNVSPEGKRFFSKKEMKDYAKEHDLELGAL